jgi:membrane-associated phospholipid phosphatase
MIAMPGTRVISMVLSIPMLVSLVAMNYHFVSDVIAGSVLGALVAAYAVHLGQLKMRTSIRVE